MNLYLVTRTDDVDYNQYKSMVCAAETERDAREMGPSEGKCPWATNVLPNTLKVELIGVAVEGTKAGPIHVDFNAG